MWVIYRPRLAQLYLGGWFWIDFPSSIPYELLEGVLYRHADEHGSLAAAQLARALRLFRLFRVLRMLRIADHVRYLEDKLRVRALHTFEFTQLPPRHAYLLACVVLNAPCRHDL
jgi:hypothetical protein